MSICLGKRISGIIDCKEAQGYFLNEGNVLYFGFCGGYTVYIC